MKATYDGAVADGVAATATLITSASDATANDKGPYFKDADGKTVRTLTGLEDGRERPAEAAEAVRGRHRGHLPAPRHHRRRRHPDGRADRDGAPTPTESATPSESRKPVGLRLPSTSPSA